MKKTFFTNTATTYRLTASQVDNEEWAASLTGVLCNIQPLDSNYSSDMEGSYGKSYLMFCDSADIIIGDKISDGTIEYLVDGLRNYSLMGFSVMEISLRETK